MSQVMTVDPDELNPTDEAILDMLQEGRCTAPYIADEKDYSTGNVRNRLNDLIKHGHVRKVYQGLYELVSDPRENDTE